MTCARKNAGLTLIEVLIALAIISIALTAIIKATAQNIRSTSYLQEKTIAMWVGQQVINEARVNLLVLSGDDKVQQQTAMLGQEWYWQASKKNTANPKIIMLKVDVFNKDPDNDNAAPLVSLESYVYHAEQ